MNEYVDQSARDLRLCISQDPVTLGGDVCLFKDISDNPIPGVRIRLGIIGASHFFSFQIGKGFVFTEMLACVEPPHRKGESTIRISLPACTEGEKGYPLSFSFPPFRYSFHGCIVRATPESLKKVAMLKGKIEQTDNAPVMGLAHDFSSALLERPPFPPETLLFFSRSGMHSLHLETAHTYPNEGLVVSTSSRLTVSDGNAFREMLARSASN
ncbi:MAG: hypothetical protein A3D67_03545 [Candidatus Lloydbacteria bacterium RIFCSPHIGHO2_02_FULL_51_22]|uniref:Uncharacterized protein n=1 Tax=Candidatus Lloydbacteria bacterium RIFCSPHIGHO2_02_FULL_51_22 TaxID=1798663 RepID=A0A1G2D9X4_9BACT|nr:MAG: hypothetical protein A3D67_03545 [Candidatus Lloydbacteria bacterium RIFCSPHIGHO2_02_FULL_51_22]